MPRPTGPVEIRAGFARALPDSLSEVRSPPSSPPPLEVSHAPLPLPFAVLGIDVLVDLNLGVSTFVLANALGTCTVGFAVPANAGYVGISFDAQFVWLDGTCPNGLSASNGIVAVILP